MRRLWTARKFGAEDQKGVIDLLNLVFGTAPTRDINLWLWEYKSNPNGSLEVVAEHQDNIIGHMGLVGADLRVRNHTIKAAQAVDLAVHPDFRRQGMFLELGKTLMDEASKEGIAIAYGIPNESAYYGHLQYGWFYVGRIPVLIKFLSAHSIFKFLVIKLYYFIRRRCSPVSGPSNFRLLPFLSSVLNWVRFAFAGEAVSNGAPPNYKLRVRQIFDFDTRFDDLWREMTNKLTVAVERNSEYLNWRYFEKPGSHYKVFVAEGARGLQGYVVLASEKSWDWASLSLRKTGFIVDLVAMSEEAISALIHSAVRYFNQKQADVILCWMMKTGLAYKCLVENGFHYDKTLQEMMLICRINTPTDIGIIDEIRQARNWFLTVGDSDLA